MVIWLTEQRRTAGLPSAAHPHRNADTPASQPLPLVE
jgi:hypothetical protein